MQFGPAFSHLRAPCGLQLELEVPEKDRRRDRIWNLANEVVTLAPWCTIGSLYILLNWWLLFTLDRECSGRKVAGLGFVAYC